MAKEKPVQTGSGVLKTAHSSESTTHIDFGFELVIQHLYPIECAMGILEECADKAPKDIPDRLSGKVLSALRGAVVRSREVFLTLDRQMSADPHTILDSASMPPEHLLRLIMRLSRIQNRLFAPLKCGFDWLGKERATAGGEVPQELVRYEQEIGHCAALALYLSWGLVVSWRVTRFPAYDGSDVWQRLPKGAQAELTDVDNWIKRFVAEDLAAALGHDTGFNELKFATKIRAALRSTLKPDVLPRNLVHCLRNFDASLLESVDAAVERGFSRLADTGPAAERDLEPFQLAADYIATYRREVSADGMPERFVKLCTNVLDASAKAVVQCRPLRVEGVLGLLKAMGFVRETVSNGSLSSCFPLLHTSLHQAVFEQWRKEPAALENATRTGVFRRWEMWAENDPAFDAALSNANSGGLREFVTRKSRHAERSPELPREMFNQHQWPTLTFKLSNGPLRFVDCKLHDVSLDLSGISVIPQGTPSPDGIELINGGRSGADVAIGGQKNHIPLECGATLEWFIEDEHGNEFLISIRLRLKHASERPVCASPRFGFKVEAFCEDKSPEEQRKLLSYLVGFISRKAPYIAISVDSETAPFLTDPQEGFRAS